MDITIDLLPGTPIGNITCAVTGLGVLAVEIGTPDHIEWAQALKGSTVVDGASPFPAAAQLAEYLSGLRKTFELPLDWRLASTFQRQVLEAVLAIPYGETQTYGQIAARIGKPGAARAVGGANAANPISIIVPCHRLVGADGSLRGYRAPDGIRTKAWLLELERRGTARV